MSYGKQSRQKWAFETSIWLQSRCLDEKSFTPRIRRTNWRACPSRSTKTNTTRTRSFLRRLLLQRPSWSTHRKRVLAFIYKFLGVVRIWMELEVSSQFFYFAQISFCYSWFRLQSIAIYCNRRGVWTEHSHTRLFLDTFILLHTSHCGSRCRTTCLHKTCSFTCHHMSERLLFTCFVFFLCLSCLYVLSHFYLFSVLNFNSHNIENVEHQTQSAPAKWGVLHRGDIQPSHMLRDQTVRQLRLLRGFCIDLQAETGDIDTELSYSCDAELDDELIGKALSSPLFIQVEKNQRTWDKLVTLMMKVCCQLSPSSHAQVRGDPYTNQVQICLKNGNPVATQKTSESGFSLKDKKSKFSLKSEPRSRSTNFKPSLIKEVSRKKRNYWFSAKGNWSYYCKWWTTPTRSTTTSRTTIRTKSGSSWNSYQKSSWDGRIEESSRITNRWIFEKNIDRKSGHFLMNSRPEFRNCRIKSIVWMTREILTVPSQYAVDHPTDTHVLTSTGDPLHLVNVKFQTQSWIRDFRRDHQPEIHSTPRREDSQIIMGQTNKDCRSRIFILANSVLQQHSLVVR